MAGAVAGVIAGVIFCSVLPARAQDVRRPFDRVELSLSGLADTGGNDDYHAYWRAGRGLALEAATPFHAGTVSLSARFVHTGAVTDAGVPSTDAWGLWTGWWLGRGLGAGLRASLGASLGFTQWTFPDEPNPGLLHETEFGVETGLRVSYALTPRWAVSATGSLQRTFTHERIDLLLISAGITRTFVAPRWVREVLQ